MQRMFVTAGGSQFHVRRAGEGPPVILLHPSPQSSAFSVPMATRLAKNFTAIAVDTPGYGLSDPLPGGYQGPGLTDYIQPLVDLLDALDIEKAAFYGNATGAEISHIFAAAHPERVAVCMLDTAGMPATRKSITLQTATFRMSRRFAMAAICSPIGTWCVR